MMKNILLEVLKIFRKIINIKYVLIVIIINYKIVSLVEMIFLLFKGLFNVKSFG